MNGKVIKIACYRQIATILGFAIVSSYSLMCTKRGVYKDYYDDTSVLYMKAMKVVFAFSGWIMAAIRLLEPKMLSSMALLFQRSWLSPKKDEKVAAILPVDLE